MYILRLAYNVTKLDKLHTIAIYRYIFFGHMHIVLIKPVCNSLKEKKLTNTEINKSKH